MVSTRDGVKKNTVGVGSTGEDGDVAAGCGCRGQTLLKFQMKDIRLLAAMQKHCIYITTYCSVTSGSYGDNTKSLYNIRCYANEDTPLL